MNKIDKIIFYSNKYQQLAMIVYTDGTYTKLSKEEGIEKVLEYINQEQIHSIDSDKVKQNILFMNEEEVLEEIKLRKKEQVKKEENSTEIKQEEINFEIKHRGIKKLALFATVVAIIASNTESHWDLKNIDLYDLVFNQDRLSLQVVLEPLEESSKELTIDNILTTKKMNPIKRSFFSDIWTYILEYNRDIGSNYDDKNKKPSHKVKEVFSQYLMYNNLTEEEYACIFGEDDITPNNLRKNYKNALEQDIMFHAVQKQTSPRQVLMKTSSIKKKFLQYENMLISFNREENNKRKVNKANNFFKVIRNDFKKKQKITRQDLGVESIIKAMQLMCKEHPEIKSLQKKEYKKICSLFENKKNEIIEQYQSYRLYNNNTFDEVSCAEFEEVVRNQLISDSIYPKDDAERDLYQTKAFKKSFRWQFKNSSQGQKKVKNMRK